MKTKKELIRIFSILFLIVAVAACDSNNGSGDTQRVLTENDFATDETLTANPETDTIVKFLEPPEDNLEINRGLDTGTTGIDIFNLSYDDTTEQTFCLDNESDSPYTMELKTADGNTIIITVEPDSECETEIIEPGDYVVTLTHDGLSDTTHAIFMVPGTEDVVAAKAEGFKAYVSNILENIFTNEVNAQPLVQVKVLYTLTTRSCADCNLAGGDFTDADLTKVNLAGANLTGAILLGADLDQTNIVGADFTGATWCEGSICPDGSTGSCDLMVRYMDNCDGTVSDADTGLMWEQKNSADNMLDFTNPNDVNNQYSWSATSNGGLDGTATTMFLDELNDVEGGGANCFAGYCDWRMPVIDGSVNEIRTILDFADGECAGNTEGACIDPVFGPTIPGNYWINAIADCGPSGAACVGFNLGFNCCASPRDAVLFVRAVRDNE